MQLPRDGVEYAHISFADLPADVSVEASIDRVVWSAVSLDGGGTGRYLLRGPDAPADPLATLVPTDRCTVWVRVADSPESLVREAGVINLY